MGNSLSVVEVDEMVTIAAHIINDSLMNTSQQSDILSLPLSVHILYDVIAQEGYS